MVELGKYTGTVLAAYGVTILLVLGLVAISLVRGARMKRALEAQERRMGKHG